MSAVGIHVQDIDASGQVAYVYHIAGVGSVELSYHLPVQAHEGDGGVEFGAVEGKVYMDLLGGRVGIYRCLDLSRFHLLDAQLCSRSNTYAMGMSPYIPYPQT